MPLSLYFVLSTSTIPGSFVIPLLVLKIFTYSSLVYKLKSQQSQILTQPAHDVPETSSEGPLKVVKSGAYRGPIQKLLV